MCEIKNLTSDNNYADLENAVKRGLKNIRREKNEEYQINKVKRDMWRKNYVRKLAKKRKQEKANKANS